MEDPWCLSRKMIYILNDYWIVLYDHRSNLDPYLSMVFHIFPYGFVCVVPRNNANRHFPFIRIAIDVILLVSYIPLNLPIQSPYLVTYKMMFPINNMVDEC